MNVDPGVVARRGERLGALLRATDPPVPAMVYPAERVARAARHRVVVRWRAAAAIAVLLAAALGVAPVRAWIVRTVRAVWSGAATRRSAPVATPSAAEAASRVAFTPAAGPFNLRVARPQAAGSLTVEAVADTAASAAVTGGSGTELVVLPDGLRIVNAPGASSSFVVRVPITVARVVVTVGAAAPKLLTPSRPGQRWVLDLRGTR